MTADDFAARIRSNRQELCRDEERPQGVRTHSSFKLPPSEPKQQVQPQQPRQSQQGENLSRNDTDDDSEMVEIVFVPFCGSNGRFHKKGVCWENNNVYQGSFEYSYDEDFDGYDNDEGDEEEQDNDEPCPSSRQRLTQRQQRQGQHQHLASADTVDSHVSEQENSIIIMSSPSQSSAQRDSTCSSIRSSARSYRRGVRTVEEGMNEDDYDDDDDDEDDDDDDCNADNCDDPKEFSFCVWDTNPEHSFSMADDDHQDVIRMAEEECTPRKVANISKETEETLVEDEVEDLDDFFRCISINDEDDEAMNDDGRKKSSKKRTITIKTIRKPEEPSASRQRHQQRSCLHRCLLFVWGTSSCLIGLLVVLSATLVGLVAWYSQYIANLRADGGEAPYFNFYQCPAGSLECCNGLPENCHRPIHDVVFATLHNAMATQDDAFRVPNHVLSMEQALETGFRAFQFDTCDCGGGIGGGGGGGGGDDDDDEDELNVSSNMLFCHGVCAGGTRDPKEVFTHLYDFLVANPNELVLLEFEITKSSTFSPLVDVVHNHVTGLKDFLYDHPNRAAPWPLMRDLIASNKRLILFKHREGPSCKEEGCPYGFHDTFRYMFETDFDLKGIEEVTDYDRSCQITEGLVRGASFFVLNHFAQNSLSLPDETLARELNREGILEERMEACSSRVGHTINLIVVDFWSFGNVLEVTQRWNKIMGITSSPSFVPSIVPSTEPTPLESSSPSTTPTRTASGTPSKLPTMRPSWDPSRTPTWTPSVIPSMEPTLTPTNAPSLLPSDVPSMVPTIRSSAHPSIPLTTTSSSSSSSRVPSIRPSMAINTAGLPTQLPNTTTTGPSSSSSITETTIDAIETMVALEDDQSTESMAGEEDDKNMEEEKEMDMEHMI